MNIDLIFHLSQNIGLIFHMSQNIVQNIDLIFYIRLDSYLGGSIRHLMERMWTIFKRDDEFYGNMNAVMLPSPQSDISVYVGWRDCKGQ